MYFKQVPRTDVLSDKCLEVLPFAEESIQKWSVNSDISDYLRRLCNISSQATDSTGENLDVSYIFLRTIYVRERETTT